jgi:hypothetical protein
MKNLEGISKEIELRRLKPEYLIDLFEQYFKQIDQDYPTTFTEVRKYNQKSRVFFKTIEEVNKSMKRVNNQTSRVLELVSLINDCIENEKDTKIYDDEIDEIQILIEKETTFITNSKIDTKLLLELTELRKDFLYRNTMGSYAVGALLKSSTFNIFTNFLLFVSSFTFAYFIGNHIEEKLSFLGSFYSKLLPAILFYFTIDEIFKRIESALLWKNVKYLFVKFQKIDLIQDDDK